MPVKLLVVCFKFKTSQPEYEGIASRLARRMLDVPGLRWKIWLINATQGKAGGIYLFDDEHTAQTFLTGPTLVAHGPIREGQRV